MASDNEEWPRTVVLARPVEFGKATITELVFQRGELGMLKGIQITEGLPPSEQLILLASRLCGQSMKVIEKLDPDDSGEVMAIAAGFIGRCLGTGRTPSG